MDLSSTHNNKSEEGIKLWVGDQRLKCCRTCRRKWNKIYGIQRMIYSRLSCVVSFHNFFHSPYFTSFIFLAASKVQFPGISHESVHGFCLSSRRTLWHFSYSREGILFKFVNCKIYEWKIETDELCRASKIP